jgi:parvulin-like peptidyl-prolyl isomerase
MNKIKKIIILMIVLIFSISVVGCGVKSVAEVNGEKITRDQLDKRIKKIQLALEQQGASFTGTQGISMLKALEKQTLDEMIDQTLLMQAAKKEAVIPSKAEAAKAIADIKTRFGGETKFNEALKQYGYTVAELEEMWTSDTSRSKLFDKITANISVTDDEIKQWYDKNTSKYKDPVKIKARTIMFKFDNPDQPAAMGGQQAPKVGRTEAAAQKLAEDIIKQLKGGADFAKLATEKSEDDRSKTDGGLVKDFSGKSPYPKGAAMSTEFDAAATALKPGQYSKTPVKTPQGYYVIKLEEIVPEKQLSLDEAKAKIREELLASKKQKRFNDYVTELKKTAKIVNNLAASEPKTTANPMQQKTPEGSSSSPSKP